MKYYKHNKYGIIYKVSSRYSKFELICYDVLYPRDRTWRKSSSTWQAFKRIGGISEISKKEAEKILFLNLL